MPRKPFDPSIGKKTRFGADWPGERCGAKRKRDGQRCQAPAMPNGRCRMHGGKSTGIKTEEGMDRMRRANTKHGLYRAPGHPDFDKMPGPFWPGLKEVRRMTRGPGGRLGWGRPTGRTPVQPRDSRGRFKKALTDDALARFIPWSRDPEEEE